jgi:hypothetical protein
MRRVVLGLTAGMALAFIPAAGAFTPASPTSTKVVVRPGTGGPHTRFRFSFRMPNSTDMAGEVNHTDTLSVGHRQHSGCVWSGDEILPRSQAGAMMRVTLNPSRLGGSWCTGTFHGEIIESVRITCGPPLVDILCPQLAVAPQVVARFTFRVTTTA